MRAAQQAHTHQVRHITVSIDRSPEDVYAFVSDPANLPKWATGLGGSIRKVRDQWIADSPMGRIKVRFAGKNDLGVLDHEVELESGARINNPMRVVPNGAGSEVVFTLIRRPDITDDKFADDARWVAKDLRILKELLEK